MRIFFKKIILTTIIPFISFLLIHSCAEDPNPSLFELIDPNAAAPVISSVEPLGQALAGVTVLTINGSNFSNNASDLVVSFNGVSGEILEATTTQIRVKVPNIVSDSVALRISKIDVEPFSTVQYRLTPALAEIKKDANGTELFTEDIVPYGLTTDALGNLYISVVEFSIGQGIKKLSPSGTIIPNGLLVNFAPKGGETFFLKLNMWQNNTILGTRGGTAAAAVFEITEGIASKVFVSQGLSPVNRDIDFDENLNVWVGGRGLFRITPSKVVKSFQYPNEIKSIRIFNGFVYILTTLNEDDAVWRFPIISSDSLGAGEEFFNISQTVEQNDGTVKVTGTDFDIAADGDIIVGTTRVVDPIIVIHQDGSFESLYPGIVSANTRVYAFDWGPEQYLYFTREVSGNIIQSIFRLDMQKQGAVQYGR